MDGRIDNPLLRVAMAADSPSGLASPDDASDVDMTSKLHAEVLQLSTAWTFWYDRGLNQSVGDARKSMTKIGK